MTLRQLFYRLVSAQVIPNSQGAYKRLSALTAEARRDGDFPALIDRGRTIHQSTTFTGIGHALTLAASASTGLTAPRDRTCPYTSGWRRPAWSMPAPIVVR